MNLANIKLKATAEVEMYRYKLAQQQYLDNQRRYSLTEKERESYLNFVIYTDPQYIVTWFNKHLCLKLDDFAKGKIKRLMVILPPQHGKSELVSRKLPAFMFGRNPNMKFLEISYSSDLATSFSRDCQKIMKDSSYSEVFRMEGRNVSGYRYAERANYFEIVGYQGYYMACGIEGGVTGKGADIVNIDDPIKGPEDAFSPTMRNKVWDVYTDVIKTRIHNDSQILLTQTRWHEDDLAGRILKYEAGEWDVVCFPGIKEDNSNPEDIRAIGEALWPERHSLERLEGVKKISYRTFISLYQGRPAPAEGGIIKKAWFKRFYPSDLPKDIVHNFRSDTAYGKEKSDNSATINYSIYNNRIYIWDVVAFSLDYPSFKKWYSEYVTRNGYTYASACVFEPKATGISVVQDLRQTTIPQFGRLNVMEDKPPKDAKETRVASAGPFIESGGVCLLEGSAWIEAFLTECATFPNGARDDMIDDLAGIIHRHFAYLLTEPLTSKQRQDAILESQSYSERLPY